MFPHYAQLYAMDCGPTSLRERSFITRSGVSMLGISDAAESIGLRTTGGNPFLYPELSKLFDVLENMNFLKTFIVNFRNIPEDPKILSIFAKESFLIKVIINDSHSQNTIINIAERLQHYNINQIWEVGVTSVRECEKTERLLIRNRETKLVPCKTIKR